MMICRCFRWSPLLLPFPQLAGLFPAGAGRSLPARRPTPTTRAWPGFRRATSPALTLFDEALRRDPGLAAAHYNRAVVLTSQGRRPEALASIEAMFVCRPEEVAPLVAVADPWYLRGTLRLDRATFTAPSKI